MIQDLRYALRILAKTPAFTLGAIATLALGIGANTAIFQLLDAVRLRSLPVVEPQRLALIQIRGGNRGWGISHYPDNLTYPVFEQIRDHQQAFSGVFAWNLDGAHVGKGAQAHVADLLLMSGNFFTTLQVASAAGRLFRPEDDNRNGCSSPGVVLSYSFWQREFAGQLSAVGNRLVLEGSPLEIIGVAPPGFTGPEVGRKFDVAAPLCVLLTQPGIPNRRNDYFWLNVMGRLKPGWTLVPASQQLAAVSPAVMQATQPTGYNRKAVKDYLQFRLEAIRGANGISRVGENYDTSLKLLLGIAGLVLLIACANLANLMLARASTRAREFAVRIAIGASRTRLIRQALSESLLLAMIGASLGLCLAGGLSAAVIHFLSTENDPIYLHAPLDWRMVAFTAGVAITVCLLLGLAPAVRSSRAEPATAIKAGGRGLTSERNRFGSQRLLVILQVSVSLVLVTGALLFVASFRGLVTLDPGFREQGILTAAFDLSRLKVSGNAWLSLRRELLDEVRSTPQVEAAASTTTFLIGGGMWSLGVNANGIPGWSRFTWVSPGYFATLDTPILAGRDFNDTDTQNSPKVAVVNQTFVNKYLHGADPLDRTFRSVAEPNYPAAEYQIVGVIKDTKYFDLRQPTPPMAYAPADQFPNPGDWCAMYIRSSAPLSAVEAAVRRRIAAWHSETGMEFHVFQRQIADGLGARTPAGDSVRIFGVLSIVLATIGLYGVLAYKVEHRRNEIGIRMALGATRSQIVGLVMGEAAVLVMVGLAIGTLGSLAVTRETASLLFGVSAKDPAFFSSGTIFLAAAATIGSFLPARRASHLDPMTALRDE